MPPEFAEAELAAFIEPLGAQGVNIRSVVHAWVSAGGDAHVGKVTIRLLSGGDSPFTAGTIHGPKGDAPPRLELSRVLLEKHGVDWLHWSDEFNDFQKHGFKATEKFPSVNFDDAVTPGEMARLVVGIRDLNATVA